MAEFSSYLPENKIVTNHLALECEYYTPVSAMKTDQRTHIMYQNCGDLNAHHSVVYFCDHVVFKDSPSARLRGQTAPAA